MTDKLNWSLAIDIPGGPKFKRSQSIDVEAYQQIQVPVLGSASAAGTKQKISVMPSGGTAQFLLITSSAFHDTDLTWGLAPPTTGPAPPSFPLDAPQILTGGTIALLGQPETLQVINKMGVGKDAIITIIVGRDATPP